jgi:ligand-binding SRPBCC domain-containing protein
MQCENDPSSPPSPSAVGGRIVSRRWIECILTGRHTMSTYTLRREQLVPRPLEEVFDFFSDARNLQRITPPWLNFQVLTAGPIDIRPGTLLDYRLKWHGLSIGWRTEIETWKPPHILTDVQIRGPYKLWHHTHTFTAEAGGTRMRDEVNYRLPLGFLGALAHKVGVRRDLERVFDFRQQAIASLFGSRAR